jgi:hypothetical protein
VYSVVLSTVTDLTVRLPKHLSHVIEQITLDWISKSFRGQGSFRVVSKVTDIAVRLTKYSQTWIQRALKGAWKCALSKQLPFIYMLKLYAKIINGENETVLYRQWFAIWRCPLRQVWLYTHGTEQIIPDQQVCYCSSSHVLG